MEIRELVICNLEIIDAILLSLKMFGSNNSMLQCLLEATMLLLKIDQIKCPVNGMQILERFLNGGLEETIYKI